MPSADRGSVWIVDLGLAAKMRPCLVQSVSKVLFRKEKKIKVIIREAEEGGFWAEVPSLPGCISEGETLEEVRANIFPILMVNRTPVASLPISRKL